MRLSVVDGELVINGREDMNHVCYHVSGKYDTISFSAICYIDSSVCIRSRLSRNNDTVHMSLCARDYTASRMEFRSSLVSVRVFNFEPESINTLMRRLLDTIKDVTFDDLPIDMKQEIVSCINNIMSCMKESCTSLVDIYHYSSSFSGAPVSLGNPSIKSARQT